MARLVASDDALLAASLGFAPEASAEDGEGEMIRSAASGTPAPAHALPALPDLQADLAAAIAAGNARPTLC